MILNTLTLFIFILVCVIFEEVVTFEKGEEADYDVAVFGFNSNNLHPSNLNSAIFAVQEADHSRTLQDAHNFITCLPKTFLTGVSKQRAKRAQRILSRGGLNVVIILK